MNLCLILVVIVAVYLIIYALTKKFEEQTKDFFLILERCSLIFAIIFVSISFNEVKAILNEKRMAEKELIFNLKQEELNSFINDGYKLIESNDVFHYVNRHANAYKTETESMVANERYHEVKRLTSKMNLYMDENNRQTDKFKEQLNQYNTYNEAFEEYYPGMPEDKNKERFEKMKKNEISSDELRKTLEKYYDEQLKINNEIKLSD